MVWRIPSAVPADTIRVVIETNFSSDCFYSAEIMSQKKKIMVDIIPWSENIEEIRSGRVQIEKNLEMNIVSLEFAKFIGCRIQTEKTTMALVQNEPLALCGKTHVLMRVKKSRTRRAKFERIEMTVAIEPKTPIILTRLSQVLLGLTTKK